MTYGFLFFAASVAPQMAFAAAAISAFCSFLLRCAAAEMPRQRRRMAFRRMNIFYQAISLWLKPAAAPISVSLFSSPSSSLAAQRHAMPFFVSRRHGRWLRHAVDGILRQASTSAFRSRSRPLFVQPSEGTAVLLYFVAFPAVGFL